MREFPCLALCLLLFGQRTVLAQAQDQAQATVADKPAEETFTPVYERAVAAYQAGRYAEAIEALLLAHKLQPEPRLLFNLAQSYRKLGNFRQAKIFFEQYLQADKEISAEMKGEIERYLSEISEQERTAALPAPSPPLIKPEPSPYKVPRWKPALGASLMVGGVGLMASGAIFLTLNGRCIEEPVPPAVQCGRLYDLLTPGAAQTAVASGLLIAGTLTLVIPYAMSARARSNATK